MEGGPALQKPTCNLSPIFLMIYRYRHLCQANRAGLKSFRTPEGNLAWSNQLNRSNPSMWSLRRRSLMAAL